jgi:hypothetical protein
MGRSILHCCDASANLDFSLCRILGGGVAGELSADYLVDLGANENQVIVGMLIEVVWTLSVVGIIVTLFPVLRMHNEALALGFSALRFIEATSTVISSIILLTLLTSSQEFAEAGFPDASYCQAAGSLLLAACEWAFIIGSGWRSWTPGSPPSIIWTAARPFDCASAHPLFQMLKAYP